MSISKIDEILFERAMALAVDPDATPGQLEWVRKFLNDHHSRHKDLEWEQIDPSRNIENTYGKIDFDLPLRVEEVDL